MCSISFLAFRLDNASASPARDGTAANGSSSVTADFGDIIVIDDDDDFVAVELPNFSSLYLPSFSTRLL